MTVFKARASAHTFSKRLALLAARVGFTRFWAITHFDNRGMIDVFRHSGFR
jgi:hypothetical protein